MLSHYLLQFFISLLMSAVTAVISYKHIFCILLKREYDCEKKGYWNAYTVYDVLLVHDKNTTHTPHESKYFKNFESRNHFTFFRFFNTKRSTV